jgi:hypothetical protein
MLSNLTNSGPELWRVSLSSRCGRGQLSRGKREYAPSHRTIEIRKRQLSAPSDPIGVLEETAHVPRIEYQT